MYFNLSTIKLSGEMCKDEVILLVIIQSCKLSNYEKYNNMIDENLKNILFIENPKNIVDTEDSFILDIEDSQLGKISIRNGIITGKKLEINNTTTKYGLPISFYIEYFDISEFDENDFLENKNIYIENLKTFLSEERNIEEIIINEVIDFIDEIDENDKTFGIIRNKYIKIDISFCIHIDKDEEIYLDGSFSAETEDDENGASLYAFFNCTTKEITDCRYDTY